MTPVNGWLAIAFDWSARRCACGVRARRLVCCAFVGLAVLLSAGGQAQAAPGYVADLKPTDEATAPAQHGRITLELNQAEETLRFELSVFGVESVVDSHFHMVRWRTTSDGTQLYLDPAEGEGPIIAFFLGFNREGVPGNGVVATGVIKKTELFGDFARRPLSDLIKHLRDGHLYVTVHALERVKGGQVFCCPIVLRGFFRRAGAN